MTHLKILESDLTAALAHPIIEQADQLAALACGAEIQERTNEIISGQNTTPQHHASMVAAAALISLKKYGFEQHPENVSRPTTTLTESSALLALKLAIAETRDEILSHQKSKNNSALHQFFAYISRAQSSQSPHEKTQEFLQARLNVYQIALNESEFAQALDHTFHSYRALLKQQQNTVAIEHYDKK